MSHAFQFGWASADITPDQPVNLRGQFHVRISEGVRDPLTATVLALESGPEAHPVRIVLVSCDLCGIPEAFRDTVREQVRERIPELANAGIILNATHTHTGPEMRGDMREHEDTGGMPGVGGVDLPVQDSEKTLQDAAKRIVEAVATAWRTRSSGGSVAYGRGHAVVGYNRRVTYEDGTSRMYGNTNDPGFSHIEGHEDHSVGLLGFWDREGSLRGVVVNVPCPSQCSEQEFLLSADYWHETRELLRQRLGRDLFVLPQCAAAGDQSPRPMVGKAAEQRMLERSGRSAREEIARRISDAVEETLSILESDRDSSPHLAWHGETIALSRRLLRPEDLEEARRESETWRKTYETLRNDLLAHPEKRETPRWYVDITRAYRRMMWTAAVQARYEQEQVHPRIPVEVHVLRIGEVVLATNPFELYLDYGERIQARSPATQTLTVQLAGPGTYLPTRRAVEGRSYGAVPASSPVGPEGGGELVENTLRMIASVWDTPGGRGRVGKEPKR